MQLASQTQAGQQHSTKIVITDDVKDQWIEECIEQLGGGWKFDAVRRDLVKKGCTPKLLDAILASAKKHLKSEQRKQGKRLIFLGLGLIALGFAIAVFKVFVLQSTTSFHITGGLGLVGTLAILRGILKLF
jgi:hypothetical protein